VRLGVFDLRGRVPPGRVAHAELAPQVRPFVAQLAPGFRQSSGQASSANLAGVKVVAAGQGLGLDRGQIRGQRRRGIIRGEKTV